MHGQSKEGTKGGNMRLGSYQCSLEANSLAARLYGTQEIAERHRHRLEVNNVYRDRLQKAGMRFSGINKEHNLVEVIELENHPFFIGCQFHPEFKSRPHAAHPIFKAFVAASAQLV
jgi:CTP synthase